jgi:integrase
VVRHLVVLHGILKRVAGVGSPSAQPASADLVERPTLRYAGEFTTLKPENVRVLRRHVSDEETGLPYLMAAFTGLRQGELLALTWGDSGVSECN